MKVLDYLKNLRKKLTGDEVYLVSSEKMGFKVTDETEEKNNTNNEVILSEEEELAVLENSTKKFFPKSGCWSSVCFSRPKDYAIGYLPCHLRDDEWLAHTMQISQKLDNIDYNKILNFVKTSELFKQERHDYEQRVVAWQIKGWYPVEKAG